MCVIYSGWVNQTARSASRSDCTSSILPLFHGYVHSLQNPTCLSGFSGLPLGSRFYLGVGEVKVELAFVLTPSFPPCNPPTVCGPIPCERQMWGSSQAVPTRSLTPSVSKHVCSVSRCSEAGGSELFSSELEPIRGWNTAASAPPGGARGGRVPPAEEAKVISVVRVAPNKRWRKYSGLLSKSKHCGGVCSQLNLVYFVYKQSHSGKNMSSWTICVYDHVTVSYQFVKFK